MTRRLLTTAIALCIAVSCARGAFVNGVERFDGTVKDLNTWEQYPSGGTGITQNDALFISGASSYSDYTTRSLKVGIGQRITAEIALTVPYESGTDYVAELFLTSN